MIYVYDIWVNWFEGEEAGYHVCHYHEWRNTDEIEVLEQVPLLYVSTPLYERIENSLLDIPNALLKQIYQRAYMRKGHKREVLTHAAVITDGKGILAFDTVGYQIPLKKSRLIPRHEYKVLDLIKRMKKFKYPGAFLDKSKQTGSHQQIHEHMIGLTRRERQLKQILYIALDQLKMSNDIEELRYWLGEWDMEEDMNLYKHKSAKEIWQLLYENVSKGWTASHEAFCAEIVKGRPLLERYWEAEKKEQTNQLQ